jgi:hypothetical protein
MLVRQGRHKGLRIKFIDQQPLLFNNQGAVWNTIQLVNDLDFYPEVLPWIAEKSLTILADSDVHIPTSAQYAPRTRAQSPWFSLAAAIRKGSAKPCWRAAPRLGWGAGVG